MVEILWFPFGKFEYRRKQIVWVLDNAPTFAFEHKWAEKPPTGYIDQPGIGGQRLQSEAGFVRPVVIWSEIEERLRQCGDNGWNTLYHYLGEVSVRALARVYKCEEGDIERMFQGVISYIGSGPCRRWVACSVGCENIATCPRPDRLPVTYNEWISHRRQQRRLL